MSACDTRWYHAHVNVHDMHEMPNTLNSVSCLILLLALSETLPRGVCVWLMHVMDECDTTTTQACLGYYMQV